MTHSVSSTSIGPRPLYPPITTISFNSPVSGSDHRVLGTQALKILTAIIIVSFAVVGLTTRVAEAARVSGVLTAYGSSTPLVSRDLHFQNRITGDLFLSPTHQDGSFAALLPPGDYSLR